MAGPVISIALREPLVDRVRDALNAYLRSLGDENFEHPKPGYWALNLEPERLGVPDGGRDGSRPFLVEANGPGNEDGQFFEDGRFIEPDWGFLLPLLGFTPANMMNVIAMCSRQIDHAVTALLAAEIMDVTTGVAFVELCERQVELVSGLPGVLAAVPETEDESPFALGDDRFLRAFAATPGFHLPK
jgi:hypothetical protein